jgi:hypothetical protein
LPTPAKSVQAPRSVHERSQKCDVEVAAKLGGIRITGCALTMPQETFHQAWEIDAVALHCQLSAGR